MTIGTVGNHIIGLRTYNFEIVITRISIYYCTRGTLVRATRIHTCIVVTVAALYDTTILTRARVRWLVRRRLV